eukprot:589802-Rhodomonas_salina.1
MRKRKQLNPDFHRSLKGLPPAKPAPELENQSSMSRALSIIKFGAAKPGAKDPAQPARVGVDGCVPDMP